MLAMTLMTLGGMALVLATARRPARRRRLVCWR